MRGRVDQGIATRWKEGALPWDRRRLACWIRLRFFANEAGATPAVPGKSASQVNGRVLGQWTRIRSREHQRLLFTFGVPIISDFSLF